MNELCSEKVLINICFKMNYVNILINEGVKVYLDNVILECVVNKNDFVIIVFLDVENMICVKVWWVGFIGLFMVVESKFNVWKYIKVKWKSEYC